MKKASLLLSVISLFLAFSAQGQILTNYQQGFEASGETYGYTVPSGTATTQTTLYSSGSQSLKISQTNTEAIVMLDTIDFSSVSMTAYYLEFFHICNVSMLSVSNPNNVATIEVKLVGSDTWILLDGNASTYYDMSWGGGSTDFMGGSSFSARSYSQWGSSVMTNGYWKKERFRLANVFVTAPLADRKLMVRFRLQPYTGSTPTNTGWYLDNITLRSSPSSMELPVMNMIAYPDILEYPSSRDTRVEMSVTTSAIAGMCTDSIYVMYRYGSESTIRRKTMSAVSGATNQYRTYIPFCGYDTLVYWRVVAKDATTNHNTATFPVDESGWQIYKSVRGYQATNLLLPEYSGNTNMVFSPNADSKSQFYFSQAAMQEMGYKAGAFKAIKFNATSNANNSPRTRYQVKLRNVDSTFSLSSRFSTDFQTVVYDSSISITQNNGTVGTLQLQDTFHYAGKGLLMTVTQHSSSDYQQLNVACFTPNGDSSMYQGYSPGVGDAFTSSLFNIGLKYNTRPGLTFVTENNLPLIHDAGISGFIHPNDSTPAVVGTTNNIEVTLKNYGAAAMNGIRIWYQVDDSATHYYDWTGTLAAGAAQNVVITSAQQYAAGYHEIKSWVDDSITLAGVLYRDHEPFNDTLVTRFIACDGPMSGVRTVGTATSDYSTLERLLFALSQCGVDGPLTVKLAPGTYAPISVPAIPGASATNMITFEPSDNSSTSVTFQPTASTTGIVAIVNLQRTHHIRFNRIVFSSNVSDRLTTYQVRLGTSSTGCQFTNCTFVETAGSSVSEDYTFSTALIYSGGCDSMLVSGCSFSRGRTAVSLVGPAIDNLAHGNVVEKSTFVNHGVNAIVIRNQVAAVVDSNYIDNLYANSSYAILLQDCYGATRATRNHVYVTSGASCLGATNLIGTATDYAVVANNMLVSADAGTSNMLTTPLNIITADYAKVLHNSIKMTAPTRSGIAAATFGGGILSNSYFYNNIVSCYDTMNFAFNFIPTDTCVNYIGNNIYYTRGQLMNRHNGVNCLNLAQWLALCPSDTASMRVNPSFLNSGNVDLITYSQNVKGHGLYFAGFDIDAYGTARDTAAPCIGAFEFSSLNYDFEILTILEPYDEYCDVPNSAELRVIIKNSGVNAFDPTVNNLTLTYSRSATPGVMVPGLSGNVVVNRTIPALDTIEFNTGAQLLFPVNGMLDSTYQFTAWLSSTIDQNPANDTSAFSVLSHWHDPAPDSITMQVDYGTAATINPTSGVQTWYSNVYTSGASHKSNIYWYDDPTATTPVYVGNPYTTDVLYTDTTLYIRQSRDYPLVKITEVQIKNNLAGVTYPRPMWMRSTTHFAVELTNVGDEPAQMEGDTLMLISQTSSLNNKIYVFPNVTIEPHHTLVLQYSTGFSTPDSSITLATNTITPAVNANFAILYKDGTGIVDGVAFGNVNTQNVWTSNAVPNTVWAGDGITMGTNSAGVYRTSWPNNPSGTPSNTSQYWQVSDSTHIMSMGAVNNAGLIRFTDNGCEGDLAPVHLQIINLPNVDIVLDSVTLPQGCGLGMTPVSVTVRNRGAFVSDPVVLHYAVNGVTFCNDTIAAMNPNTYTTHTFSLPANLSVTQGTETFVVRIWVDQNSSDLTTINDTTVAVSVSSFMPNPPLVNLYDTVDYANRITLQSTASTLTDSLMWYDRMMNVLDITNVFTSDYLYVDDTFYVSSLAIDEGFYQVGEATNTNNGTAYPSPYNPNKKYVKEQYLYQASDLIEAGHSAGIITSISFYLDTVLATTGYFDATDYVISMGTTSDQIFSANNNWHTVSEVYSVDTLTFSNSNKGWVKHELETPFVWNGVDNIVVQVTRTVNPNVTTGAKTRYTSSGANRVLYKNDNNNSLVSYSSNGARSANLPNALFGFVVYGCESATSPIYVHVTNTPPNDGSIAWSAADTLSYASCGASDLTVSVTSSGSDTLTSYTIDYWIDGVQNTFAGVTPILPDSTLDVVIAQPSYTPGRHLLKAAVTVPGDTVQINDTIQKIINVRFCAGTYTIGAGGYFADFSTAVDTLNNAGVDGPVVFSVLSGTYDEQIVLGAVEGSSATNTITFESATQNAEDVILKYSPTASSNYVLSLNGASNYLFNYMTFYGYGTSASSPANVITMENAAQIHFNYDVVRVKSNLNNTNASCMVVGDGVQYIYVEHSTLDSGYYGIRSIVPDDDTTYGFYIRNNVIQNFWFQGIYLRKVDEVYVTNNSVTSGVNVNGRALTGIYVAEHSGPVTIEANNVILSDNRNGGKVGIRLSNITGSPALRSKVYNNMTAILGSGTSGQLPAGIWLDSCLYMNVFYNSALITPAATTNNNMTNTKSLYVKGISQELSIMNNLFSNHSYGYAYYVEQAGNVATSDYNNYYGNHADRLAYWGADAATFDALKASNNMDIHSMNVKAYFRSATDLRLSIGTFCEKAQYNTDVPRDIFNVIRPQIPNPCMGAEEFERAYHNVAVMEILAPKLGETDNVETDTLWVHVKLTNDGQSTESNLHWWAEIEGYETQLHSANMPVEEIQPQDVIYDSTYIVMPIGIIDTQTVVVHFPLSNDSVPENNVLSQVFFLDPAFNFQADSVTVQSGDGCRLQQTPISITVKNVGRKPIPVGYPVTIGFQAILQTTGITVSTLPALVLENITTAEEIAVNYSYTFNFSQTANLYPTGNAKDISVRARGWASSQYDQKPTNDTTPYKTVTSKYTPSMPVGVDLHIPYATWDTIFASHTDITPTNTQVHNAIRWYRDSTDAEPFFAPNSYPASQWWETPQYFRDTVYYLSCVSAAHCTSYYNPVHVYINSRLPNDVAVEAVVEPQLHEVYMFDDSVKVNIINYGTQAVSNIPVVYQLWSTTNVLLQEVSEVCTATIQPNESYVYRFDSLIHIPTWSATSTYGVRAWTDLGNDGCRLNDTVRGDYVASNVAGPHLAVVNKYLFNASPEQGDETANPYGYYTPNVQNTDGMDIAYVAFNSLENRVSPVGHDYINFASIGAPEIEALHLVKGTTDTLILQGINNNNLNDNLTTGFWTVYIDRNRDGYFAYGDGGVEEWSEIVYADTAIAGQLNRFPLTLPSDIRLGYMRMRVVLEQAGTGPLECNGDAVTFGNVQDYLLYIEDLPDMVDITPSRIVSPFNAILDSTNNQVAFMLTNKGRSTVTSAQITYAYISDGVNTSVDSTGTPIADSTASGTLNWTGSLAPGTSVRVDLPARDFPEGTTDVMIVAKANGDTIVDNDTLWYQYHRFKVIQLVFEDDFEDENIWYAPRGYGQWDENVWQRGFPQKPNIMSCVSDSNVWATNLTGFVTPGSRGNLSILYTPIINIAQIRADTISLWASTMMAEGSSARLEFKDYRGYWITVGSANDFNWYTGGEGWQDTSSGFGYVNYKYSTQPINGDFPQYIQFRFVYKAAANTQMSDGISVDNFRVGRAQRAIDVGVESFVYPTEPRFGQTISPKILIKNYGYEPIYSVEVGYRPYGVYLPIMGLYTNEEGLQPGAADLYTFETPFTVMDYFPDTFQICGFTSVSMDLYRDNDTVCNDFYLSPLDNDMAMVSFSSPLDRVIAGDSLTVTTLIRNYGQAPVTEADVTFVLNSGFTVTEHVTFADYLGHDLQSFEYFNYTFSQRIRSSMGLMSLTAYVDMSTDDYRFNDTITKTVNGISAIKDLYAREIIVDESYPGQVRINLVVENAGAMAVNDFEIGFWYHKDTSTLFTARYHSEHGLPALSTLYYLFDTVFPPHAEYFNDVTAYVHVDGDNDPSNDTTSYIGQRYVELVPARVIVEENRTDECRVRMEINNIGNVVTGRDFHIYATINGTSIRTRNISYTIEPGQVGTLEFSATIPKSPTRTYVGEGHFESQDDQDATNNQTTIIEVLNYFEGIPLADASNGMTLEQNYPNPFGDDTRIDFYIPTSGSVRFFVMDELGRLVYQSEQEYGAGEQSIRFSGKSLPTGVYYYGIEMDGEKLMRKMVFKK